MKILVLAGGLSTERDVSLESGAGVCRALKAAGHQAVMVDVFLGMPGETGDFDEIFARGEAAGGQSGQIGILDPDIEKIKAMRTGNADGFFGENVIRLCRQADMVYMGLHGAEGENGKLQAALDVLGIPYTGSGYLGSALAMDKALAKQLFMQAGVPGARGFVLKKEDAQSVPAGLSLPCVVKPCCGGSSVGVSIVGSLSDYEEAVRKAFRYEDQIVVEEYIEGREFSVGILGGRALPVIEIIPKEGFFDYEKKYQSGMSEELCPAELEEKTAKKMQRYAVMVYQALHLECYARIDFLMDKDGNMYCLEANTLPGMTPASLLPKEAAAVGLSYEELCEQIIALAYRKYAGEANPKLRLTAPEEIAAAGKEDLWEDYLYTKSDRKSLPDKTLSGLTAEKIAEICEGKLYGSAGEEEIRAVTLDSRKVEKGSLFIATAGERVDGNSFIASAYDRGALCCMSEREPENTDKAYIVVKDCFAALKKLAAYYRGQCSAKVIGITGSVGKTTTKEMIASVLSQKYYTMKTLGNYNNEIGLPLTLLRIKDNDEFAVVEMGISDFGEMDRLAEIAAPDMVVITNLGDCHLEKLGDRDGVFRAKTEVFAHMKDTSPVFLNGDDERLAAIAGRKDFMHPLTFFGMEGKHEIYAENVRHLGLYGISLDIVTPKGSFGALISVPGKHMIANALCATAIGLECGLSLPEIARGIASFTPIGGRSNILHTLKYTIMDDCYNANPVSMKAGLDMLSLVEGRRVAILGDMFELGENEDRMHYEVGCHALEAGVDVLICIGEHAGYIAAGAAGLSMEEVPGRQTEGSEREALLNAALREKESRGAGTPFISYYKDLDSAQNAVDTILKKGDSILVKASHGMHLEQIVRYLAN